MTMTLYFTSINGRAICLLVKLTRYGAFRIRPRHTRIAKDSLGPCAGNLSIGFFFGMNMISQRNSRRTKDISTMRGFMPVSMVGVQV